MNKGSFGIKRYDKHQSSPFENEQINNSEGNSTKIVQINKDFLPKIFSLSRTGIKLLSYFLINNKHTSGTVYFNLKECKQNIGFNDKRSIYNGLIELLGEGIIARTENENIYYLNTGIISNCD